MHVYLAAISTVVVGWWPRAAMACPWCRGEVEAGIYDDRFWANLGAMLAPTLVFVGVALFLPARLERRGQLPFCAQT